MSSKPSAESIGYDELAPYWNGFFKASIFFSYARCVNCGLLFCPEYLTNEQMAALYSQMPPNMGAVPTPALSRTQQGYAAALDALTLPRGAYLEIGPDVGLLLEHMIQSDRFDYYWLFEPNRAVTVRLEARLTDKRFTISHDMLDFSQVPDGSIAVAAMIQVFDHLIDPAATLKELKKKLAPGGVLLIVTHDESSLLRKVVGSRWPAFSPQHPQLYNPNSMRKILESNQYSAVSIRQSVNFFPISFLMQHALWALGLKFKGRTTYSGPSVGLALGNILTLARG